MYGGNKLVTVILKLLSVTTPDVDEARILKRYVRDSSILNGSSITGTPCMDPGTRSI